MSEKDKLKSQVYLIIFIFIFLMIVITGVYAYYITKDFKYGSFDVEVKTKGVDTLKIKSGNDININVNDHNFIKDVGHSITGETSIDVNLDTTKEKIKYCYDVYYEAPEYEVFKYSNYPNSELTLNVYSKVNDEEEKLLIENMDITTVTGKVNIPINLNIDNYEHSIDTVKRVNKNIKYIARVTYNYFKDVDQGINNGANYKAKFNIDNVRECK